ncbi:MAG: methylated-DNA--[protein]-cysteine S-methyltransferase [Nitriliruptorales bacterium]|nr:methylated-DNA--[protein]-cysteine S-methyltransferase [Nitriliruptorales bacterium]
MKVTTYCSMLPSPLGELTLVADGEHLTGLHLPSLEGKPMVVSGARKDSSPFREVIAQLEGYFAGTRTTFEVPLAPQGTPFQQRVWQALQEIPYGRTASYGQLAERIGSPRAVRAVGLANGRNPIPIIIPCHRVIGADGSLTGYGGGMDRKRLLLDLEAHTLPIG